MFKSSHLYLYTVELYKIQTVSKQSKLIVNVKKSRKFFAVMNIHSTKKKKSLDICNTHF